MFDRPHGHLRLQRRLDALMRPKSTLYLRRFRVAEVAFGVVRRARDPLIPERDRELLKVPHYLPDLGPNRWRQVLDFY